jgi:hypothetical protein
MNLYTDDILDHIKNKSAEIYVERMYGAEFIIADNKMTVKEFGRESDTKEEYDIVWEDIGKFSYITFNYNGNFLGNKATQGQKRYLILYSNDYVTLYDSNNKLIYFNRSIKQRFSNNFTVKASSELQEKNTSYLGSNIIDQDILIPWAEASNSNGVNEYLEFTPNWNVSLPYIYFVFSNGFVDYNRNNLYNDNNRAKKIRIINDTYDECYEIDLEDTPNYQTIMIEFKNVVKKIKIEILEVYQGEKYNDLCINLIMPWAYYG